MNNLIDKWDAVESVPTGFAAVTPPFARLRRGNDRRYKNVRKLRTDSILGGLPAGQRAMVDKWLFDKGMTYEQVAEACGKMFGVKVSKSSVGRYFQSVSKVPSPKSKVGEGAGRGVSEKVGEWLGEEEKLATPEEVYEELLVQVRKMAFLEANLPAELRDLKFFCELMRILIAARRERNQAVLASVERKKFEVWAAKKVLKHLRSRKRDRFAIDDLRVNSNEPGSRRLWPRSERNARGDIHCAAGIGRVIDGKFTVF
jgi:DNA-binding transcriptional ArsR family regulator